MDVEREVLTLEPIGMLVSRGVPCAMRSTASRRMDEEIEARAQSETGDGGQLLRMPGGGGREGGASAGRQRTAVLETLAV